MNLLQNRLLTCQQRGWMTITDLSVWFDRPRPTVSTWVLEGRQVMHPAAREVEADLARLERKVRDGWQVPTRLRGAARREFIVKARGKVNARSAAA